MLYRIGNRKIGRDTIIMNITSAANCPSRGICLIGDRCYALKAERLYKNVLPYRLREEEQWDRMTAGEYAEFLTKIKTPKLRYIRWQESGDFRSQADVDKMSDISEAVRGLYVCYTYTARNDLDYSSKSNNLIITGSYFMVDNMFIAIPLKTYDHVSPALACPGDCRKCSLCKKTGNTTIYAKYH